MKQLYMLFTKVKNKPLHVWTPDPYEFGPVVTLSWNKWPTPGLWPRSVGWKSSFAVAITCQLSPSISFGSTSFSQVKEWLTLGLFPGAVGRKLSTWAAAESSGPRLWASVLCDSTSFFAIFCRASDFSAYELCWTDLVVFFKGIGIVSYGRLHWPSVYGWNFMEEHNCKDG